MNLHSSLLIKSPKNTKTQITLLKRHYVKSESFQPAKHKRDDLILVSAFTNNYPQVTQMEDWQF